MSGVGGRFRWVRAPCALQCPPTPLPRVSATSGSLDAGLRVFAAHRIRAEHPDNAVLVLAQYAEEAYALGLLSESTESTGYVPKDRIADERTSPTPCSGWPTEARRWIPRSSA
jgi:hypothetical protein